MKIHLKKLSDFVYQAQWTIRFTLRAGSAFPDCFLHHYFHPVTQLSSGIYEQ